ncbi:hypothetical protein PIB30_050315 [Stylosanthes scabra]|uniref:Uncharacterized protein n=1 Tax=Stylosanthes scabra TaxID=79078 RepID=A0ABU6RHM4_9FABA|nr:hypothetical protein [Stylosanthes scabra]
MLIITYISTHNHPSPDEIIFTANLSQKPNEEETEETTEENLSKPSSAAVSVGTCGEKTFHYLQSPIRSSHEEIIVTDQDDPLKLSTLKSNERIDLLLEDPLRYAQIKNLATTKSEELDFFNELQELPMSSSFLHITRSILSYERIPVFSS